MRKIKNKKAILLPGTLKLLLAAICLLILIYLGYVMTNLLIVKTQLEQARANIKEMFGIMDTLKDGQVRDYIVLNPKEYTITAWPGSSGGIPETCSNRGWRTCLCFCKGSSASDCDSKGECSDLGERKISGTVKYSIEDLLDKKKNLKIAALGGKSYSITTS